MKSLIDTSRANALYLGGVGILMLTSLLSSNLPQLLPATYFHILFQRELTGAFLVTGSCLGLLAFQRHSARTREPWKVPQSQVSICFALFFVFTLAGILLSR